MLAEELFAPDAIDYFVMILGYANVIHGVVASITLVAFITCTHTVVAAFTFVGQQQWQQLQQKSVF